MSQATTQVNIDTQTSIYDPASDQLVQTKYLVIGAGPTGLRFVHELLNRQPNAHVSLFSNEPYQPYNRVKLSSLLAGEIDFSAIENALPNSEKHPNFRFQVVGIHSIDTAKNQITDNLNVTYDYDKLILATGARAHQPDIPGYQQQGVYTFRNLKDTEHLFTRVNSARHIVVVGGGLLGIEAAHALLRNNTKVTLIQQGSHLMNRQIDESAANYLAKKLTDAGVEIIVNDGVREIVGDQQETNSRVTGIVTRSKKSISCDTVVMCAGIRPNMEIARNAKIKVARGIVVDNQLQTSQKNVYAIGECAEHDGETYGIVTPGYEQAAICADILSKGTSRYVGSQVISRLKVIGESVCSMGDAVEYRLGGIREHIFHTRKTQQYRKLIIRRGKITGAIVYGDWKELQRIQEMYQSGRHIWPWQEFWFRLTGNLFFGEGSSSNVTQWPLNAIICQCNNISHEAILQAREAGCKSVLDIQKHTTAGTVCGTCKPLLEQFSLEKGPREKEKNWLLTIALSVLAAAIALIIIFVPALEVSDSVQTQPAFEKVWNDKFYKQVTGFSLLGMSVLGLLMSLRKKLPKLKLGNFAYWRTFHISLGLLCATTLIAHTGLHLGENFNQLLMIDFIAVLILGSLAGLIIGASHTLSSALSTRLRRFGSGRIFWLLGHYPYYLPYTSLLFTTFKL